MSNSLDQLKASGTVRSLSPIQTDPSFLPPSFVSSAPIAPHREKEALPVLAQAAWSAGFLVTD